MMFNFGEQWSPSAISADAEDELRVPMSGPSNGDTKFIFDA
jgi:hypothetical protein